MKEELSDEQISLYINEALTECFISEYENNLLLLMKKIYELNPTEKNNKQWLNFSNYTINRKGMNGCEEPKGVNMTKIIPVGTRVFIQRDEAEKQKNGLIIPNEEKRNTGVVKAVGDDCKKLKEGDRVLFAPYTPTIYEGLLVFREEDIIAILEE